MLGKDYQIDQLTKENKALTKANRTLEAAIEKRYQQYVDEIMDEIGSVENAVHAIHYRDNLQKGIEWTNQTNPELAENVAEIIDNVQRNYERAMLQEKEK